ncbi:phytanoyl-CoA dioxygenase family protein [Arthrobacter sp. TMS2-4]
MHDSTRKHEPVASRIPEGASPEAAAAVEGLYTRGVIAEQGAFTREWAAQMREDIDAAFAEALARPNGAVGRGPKRYYVEIHPEQLRGWVELVDHPWVRMVCESVLGPDYEIVELGFDIPGPGAVNQPWHRDFPMPEETRETGRLTSLAFNLTGVDTEEDMGPFEVAPGTQWDLPEEFDHGMFPPRSAYPRYEGRSPSSMPCRSGCAATWCALSWTPWSRSPRSTPSRAS